MRRKKTLLCAKMFFAAHNHLISCACHGGLQIRRNFLKRLQMERKGHYFPVAIHLRTVPGVFTQFKARRKEGHRSSPTWLKKTAMREMGVHYPLAMSSFSASNGWFVRFCNRFRLVLRKKTNKKKGSVLERSHKVTQFHGDLRARLATNQGRRTDPKWGCFKRNNRYNKDHSPLL